MFYKRIVSSAGRGGSGLCLVIEVNYGATDRAEAWPRGATPRPRSGRAAERSYPMSKGVAAVAVRAQEGREELLHVQGQEGWP